MSESEGSSISDDDDVMSLGALESNTRRRSSRLSASQMFDNSYATSDYDESWVTHRSSLSSGKSGVSVADTSADDDDGAVELVFKRSNPGMADAGRGEPAAVRRSSRVSAGSRGSGSSLSSTGPPPLAGGGITAAAAAAGGVAHQRPQKRRSFTGGPSNSTVLFDLNEDSPTAPSARQRPPRRIGQTASMRPPVSTTTGREGSSGPGGWDALSFCVGRRKGSGGNKSTGETSGFGVRSTRESLYPGMNSGSGPNSAGSSGSRNNVPDTETALLSLNSVSDWEGVAAAAAVAAASTQVSNGKRLVLYNVGEKVLVYLEVLNKTFPGSLSEDAAAAAEAAAASGGEPLRGFPSITEDATLFPVNIHGYPENEPGPTPAEQRGPYVFVLATVIKVHFEEDARYYTVRRADTGMEQRADTEWMERIESTRGIAAAERAAKQTKRAASTKTRTRIATKGHIDGNCWTRTRRYILSMFQRIYTAFGKRCAVYCGILRRYTKKQATDFLYGNSPFECKFSLTGINLLVACSILFMFLDQIKLCVTDSSIDWPLTVVELVVWVILTLELIFEAIIRPGGYSVLMKSEKAYAPSTARYINAFHLCAEISSLILFAPELRCLSSEQCGEALDYSLLSSSVMIVSGPAKTDAFLGRLYFVIIRLRIFALVRHWKKMWLNHTFTEDRKKGGIFHGMLLPGTNEDERSEPVRKKLKKKDDDDFTENDAKDIPSEKLSSKEEDKRLSKAATIGTALMVINSHRAMILVVAIVGILPLIFTLDVSGYSNPSPYSMVDLLQGNNLDLRRNDTDTCDQLQITIEGWLRGALSVQYFSNRASEAYVLWGQLLPVRCDFQRDDGVFTICPPDDREEYYTDAQLYVCNISASAPLSGTVDYLADELSLRPGVLITVSDHVNATIDGVVETFNVTSIFNLDHSVALTNISSIILQATLLCLILAGLSVLRLDAKRLVLEPLRRMLKIVLRYAANPLSPTPRNKTKKKKGGSSGANDDDGDSDSDSEYDANKDQLGNYETEKLITAIAKITDLLRKCWGVAGAGIISSNLARTSDGKTVVFNPLVPGKLVYALFGFAGINEFSKQLRALDQEVINLINDVAKVIHEEVYRWGYGDSGQCNKNLGGAFLMVYRIGDFKDVQEKRDRATNVIFSQEKRSGRIATLKNRKNQGGSGSLKTKYRNGMIRRRTKPQSGKRMNTLQLASLPGITTFTDRALIGMLKSFAGIYRDRSLLNWKNDFRLGAGVGAFSVDMIFGMDAGWAVEGAVGSEYKIDATYLSPHVNMASRMMSACKQYGVSILLSQAVEELLSDPARSKLRHIDTVTVKGTSVKQRIFTYDARHKGVDFFLFERPPEQADLDSDRYSPNIWNTDQDLKAMRQHVTEEFQEAFKEGRRKYLAGHWKEAIECLSKADKMMITNVIEEGYLEYNMGSSRNLNIDDDDNEESIRLRQEIGDGPCRCLISFMEREGGVAPKNWKGFRALTSK